jgi:hypothetical protein
MMSYETPSPIVVGWKERIDLLDFGLRHVKAKIDTGARTSALSAAYYVLRDTPEGRVADLTLTLDRHRPNHTVQRTVPVLATVVVKCTGGQCETRPVIETRVRLGPVIKPVLFTLTDRSHMLTPLILGRQALEGHFVVDASCKYLHKIHR